MSPFFSIIIPVYNRENRIAKAIDSILNQSYNNWELIIVDDASTDNTEKVLKIFLKDERVIYIKNSFNKERCISRNIGIEKAKGKYICFLDSDDYHLPNHLETFYNEIHLKNEPEAFFFVNAWNESEDGERTLRACPDFEYISPYTYMLRHTVNPQRWAVHRNIFNQVKFDPEVIIAEDMDTSLRILEKGFPFFQIKQRTTVYVAASDSFTYGDSNKWEKELFYFQKIFKKPELRCLLPKKETNRLLSMCYFHLSSKKNIEGKSKKSIIFALKSFLLFPKGYNNRTNKILLFNIYNSIFRKKHY
jgi:glycosyltransferase involved in cell wall biosynthesis